MTIHYNPGLDVEQGKFEDVCVPQNSEYDSAHTMKSEVSGQKAMLQQATVNMTQHTSFSGLHTANGTSLRRKN